MPFVKVPPKRRSSGAASGTRVSPKAAQFLRSVGSSSSATSSRASTLRVTPEVEFERFAKNRDVGRALRARSARALSTGWTSMHFTDVCEAMRSDRPPAPGSKVAKIVAGLEAYLRHSAPRAPAIPRGIGHPDPTRLVLWRGVEIGPHTHPDLRIPEVGGVMSANGGCYVAFSHDVTVASMFAGWKPQTAVLFRLHVSDVARSTPWAWFDYRARERNVVASTMEDEAEVLLPPGYFVVLHDSGISTTKKRVVEVAYTPEPRYLLKAQIHPLDPANGMPVVRTVGGGAHKFRDARLRNQVRVRAAAVASAAAARAAAARPARSLGTLPGRALLRRLVPRSKKR